MGGGDKNPFASLYGHVSGVLGALGIVSIADDVANFPSFAGATADLWGRYVSPVGRFLFGWLDAVFWFDLPSWTYDYLLLGVIFGAGVVRTALFDASRGDADSFGTILRWLLFAILLWPIFLVVMSAQLHRMHREGELTQYVSSAYMLFSPLIYAALLVVVSYAISGLQGA